MSEAPVRHRSAWLEIDLDAIRHNLRVIGEAVGPGVALAPVVKAEAYGHGLAAVTLAGAEMVEAFCVATLDEALTVRALTGRRVIVLYPVPHAAATDALAAGVELTIMAAADLAALEAAAGSAAVPTRVQLCVETGMGRGGLPPSGVAELAGRIAADPRFELAGLWTHLASPDDAAVSAAAVEAFDGAARSMEQAALEVPPRHVASSSGIFSGTAPSHSLVRPGLAAYGLLDAGLPLAPELAPAAAQLRPAMTLVATPVAFSQVPPGGTVGYGGRWRADRPSRVAILPLGYGDGYLRLAHPDAAVLVHGRRAPLAGAVSMDGLAVDVTDLPDVGYGDRFVLLGVQGAETISAGELARWRNTIPWEVLSGMAGRLDRVYYPQAGADARVAPAAPNRR